MHLYLPARNCKCASAWGHSDTRWAKPSFVSTPLCVRNCCSVKVRLPFRLVKFCVQYLLQPLASLRRHMIGRISSGLSQRCAAATGCLHHYLGSPAVSESLPASLVARTLGTASVSTSAAQGSGAHAQVSRTGNIQQQASSGRRTPLCHSTGLSHRQASGAASQAAAAAPTTLPPGPDPAADEHHQRLTPGRVHNLPPPPWTPTKDLRKRNFLPRRMGHLMQVQIGLCQWQ